MTAYPVVLALCMLSLGACRTAEPPAPTHAISPECAAQCTKAYEACLGTCGPRSNACFDECIVSRRQCTNACGAQPVK